mmetsp:Transcript_109475/g.194036  ORF Transcript_109475/g.194036 Transcript_109475/m.194036 type:complete len:398 (+) Transcript_109475:73-1266(+)
MDASDEPATDRLRSPLRARTLDEFINRVRSDAKARPRSTDSTFLQTENLASGMVALTITQAVVQGLVVLGAYFFMHSTGREILPKCAGAVHFKATNKEEFADNMCFISSYCFWTYPILCPYAVVLIFWKNLLEKRLFYECLMNGMFLTYRSYPFLISPTFWCVLLYGACSLVCFAFVDRAHALENRTLKEIVFSILTYSTPFAQFFCVVFTQWSPNTVIVSLATFFNQDCEKACEIVNGSTFVHSDELREAWEEVEDVFEHLRRTEHLTFEVDTSELMGMILSEHKELQRSKSQPAVYTSYYDRIDWKKCGRRCHGRFWRGYWISRILWFDQLKDNVSWNFRFWARSYMFFMVLTGFLFAWAMVSSTQEWLRYQNMLPSELKPVDVDIPGPHKVLPN